MARRRKKGGTSSQMDLFAAGGAPAGKKKRGRKGKSARPRRAPSSGKSKRHLKSGEVRTYTSKSGRRYELRRLN